MNPRSTWRLRTRTLRFGRIPLLMGILNVTPDSFSDGGRYSGIDAALKQAEWMINEGADIIDVGGESTRPYATPVSLEEELARVTPVVEAIVERLDAIVSIDTSKSVVATEAMNAGAEIINDVTGLEGDPNMIAVARETNAGVCAMHMQGTPQTMQDNPQYDDIVSDISTYLIQRRDALLDAGIEHERICLDPGIGFGKEHHHNVELLANAEKFHALGCPILVGHSRKGFMGTILADKERSRAAATAGVAVSLAMKRIQVIRVHDIGTVRDTIKLFDSVGGIDGQFWTGKKR